MKKFITNLRLAVWTGDFAWKIATLLIAATGGTTATFLAKGLAVFGGFGWLAWYGVGLLATLVTVLIIYLVRLSQQANAQALLTTGLMGKSTRINPLAASFSDEVIHVVDLHLPGRQMHENKQFRRCKFVGPGAIALLGGTIVRNKFNGIGDILTFPAQTTTTGITVLQNCTIEECEFLFTTIIIPRDLALHFSGMDGVRVAM